MRVTHPPATSLDAKIAVLIQLSRWREHVPFTIPLTIIGAMLAIQVDGQSVDWRLLLVVIANILAMAFAFMINDVVDAPDDALVPQKKARNPVSNGTLSYREGHLYSGLVALAAFIMYAVSGPWPMLIGGFTIALCYLYSAKPIRLKARPITDVVSHALMLSGLLIASGYFIYHSEPGLSWYVMLAMSLFSAYGQFYNQLDDYVADKEAGLKNTVVLLGKTKTTALMYLMLVGAAFSLGWTIKNGLFPYWLATVVIVGFGVSLLFPWETDMRGNRAEGTGSIQKPMLFVANITAFLWLAASLGLMPL